MADTFCMINTAIATGKRMLYTDDEEHGFEVRRPTLFNGIPVDLTERTDLASRTIKLWLPPIGDSQRRLERELWAELEAARPRIFGALLDGVVGALRGWQGVKIERPSRMADFERWAEAGCRAMGFAAGEFEAAYRANREGSLEAACEGSAVAMAIRAMLAKGKPFRGTMTKLYTRLESFKGTTRDRDWPKDPTRLSTELRRVVSALSAVGVVVQTDLDLRDEGHGQRAVDIRVEPR